MHVLLTNDDGIRAPGLRALHAELRSIAANLLVVAPLTVQSATSHSITCDSPLMTEAVRVDDDDADSMGIAVDGRPADCTKLAITRLWPDRFGEGTQPDLVVSGMNSGANAGINTLYSGTVAAALEAAFFGVPAISVSMTIADRTRTRFDIAAQHARRAIEILIADGLPAPHTVLNVNIPKTESQTPFPELRIVPVNLHAHVDRYELRIGPAGQQYYWAMGDGMSFQHTSDGSDVEALAAGHITVTPMHYDLTNHSLIERYRTLIHAGTSDRNGIH
ncbi:MAG: 5'/3'-nucleotidase SurE [Phycisphaerales bacterium]|nr:5'/3'-nucleotidase SurE [Phycisphaerales bacterium]